MSERKSPNYAAGDAHAKAEAANREASYYVDPNEHHSPEKGPNEPVGEAKDASKMIGETTGGQDHFDGGSM